MESQIAEILERMRGIDEIKELQQRQGSDLLDLKASIDTWKPGMEKSVSTLQAAVGSLQRQMEGVLKVPLGPDPSSTNDGLSLDSIRELGRVAIPTTTTGPVGRREDQLPRGRGMGVLPTPNSPPANGEQLRSPILPTPVTQFNSGVGTSLGWGGNTLNTHTQFPLFDGSNPKLWHTRCSDYFEMYEVHSTNWVRLASMHFVGNAALWLQSAERRLRNVSWNDFAALVIQKFGRDQHQGLIRQFFHIRQTATVAEYVDQFESIDHSLTPL